MTSSQSSLLQDALAIWHAGVDAVRGDSLVANQVAIDRETLLIAGEPQCDLREIDRVIVVGGGKATSAMASGLERVWQHSGPKRIAMEGWINVPVGSFNPDDPLLKRSSIRRHAARDAGSNEPTATGVFGTERMLEMARSAGPRDLVLCLISGGASALMPSPIEGLSLDDKLAVTRFLSRSGANIEQLNEVRRCLSHVKGGGLARACCNAHRVVTLIISDVLGDPLHVIGSGPTVLDPFPNPRKAITVLDQFDSNQTLPAPIRTLLEHQAMQSNPSQPRQQCPVVNCVLANNATAVDAAGVEAVRRGYAYWMQSSPRSEGDVNAVATELSRAWFLSADVSPPDCLISGGEPTVQLPEKSSCGKGGRNQQLALAVLRHCAKHEDSPIRALENMVAVFGGTDGEDGPTTAAGAILHAGIMAKATKLGLDIDDFLTRCDAYHFFEATDGLLETGPTHTNVCDLRVLLVPTRAAS